MPIPYERFEDLLYAGLFFQQALEEVLALIDDKKKRGQSLEQVSDSLMDFFIAKPIVRHATTLAVEAEKVRQGRKRVHRNRRYQTKKLGADYSAEGKARRTAVELYEEAKRAGTPAPTEPPDIHTPDLTDYAKIVEEFVVPAKSEANAYKPLSAYQPPQAVPTGVQPQHSDWDPAEDPEFAKPPVEF